MNDEYRFGQGYERLMVSIDKKLEKRLKYLTKLENTNFNKLFGQFIKTYVHFLDSSFVKPSDLKRSRVKKAHFLVDVPDDVYHKFLKKIDKEGIDKKAVLVRFVKNYVAFVSNVYERNE